MTSYQFKNYKHLELYMDKKIRQILDRCADLAIEKLTQNILNSVYDWSPSQYERTYQLLDSISRTEVVKNVTGFYVVEIYFDYRKMQPKINNNKWNAHADFWGSWITGEQSASDLVNWLEYGTDNKYYSHPEYRFYGDTLEWIQNEYKKIFKGYASQLGVPIE